MAGTMDKIKAKVDQVMHKDKTHGKLLHDSSCRALTNSSQMTLLVLTAHTLPTRLIPVSTPLAQATPAPPDTALLAPQAD